jgi:hypothetical protein
MNKIRDFTIQIQDILGTGQIYPITISEIDMIKDIKNKLNKLHP